MYVQTLLYSKAIENLGKPLDPKKKKNAEMNDDQSLSDKRICGERYDWLEYATWIQKVSYITDKNLNWELATESVFDKWVQSTLNEIICYSNIPPASHSKQSLRIMHNSGIWFDCFVSPTGSKWLWKCSN